MRATALFGASTAANCSPISPVLHPMQDAADNCHAPASFPAVRPLHFQAAAAAVDHLSSVVPRPITTLGQHPQTKPLLSFHSNSAEYDPTFRGICQQAHAVPLLPTSTLLSPDPSYFEKMLKEWSHSVVQHCQSHVAGAEAPVPQPALCPPPVFEVDADDDVLCIDSPKPAARDSRTRSHGSGLQDVVLAGAGVSDEIVCVSSSDSDDESEVDVNSSSTLQPVAASITDSTCTNTGSGDLKLPASGGAPRGIMHLFSPIANKSHADAAAASAGSCCPSPSHLNEDMTSSAIPIIVNPVFTELTDDPATKRHVTPPSPTGNPLTINPSVFLQPFSAVTC